MNRFTKIITLLCFVAAVSSCSKDEDLIVTVPASDGSTLTLNGLIGAEAGTSAGNSVFVDFSTDKQTSVARASWDLGFYSGTEFRVVLNNTAGAAAIVTTKTDLNTVTAADTIALAAAGKLNLGQGQGTFSLVDPVDGNLSTYLTGTVIKEVSATEADNKVYIVSPGNAGIAGLRYWQKIRVIRSGNGYALQYAKINETTFKTLTIIKDAAFNFKYASFTTGAVNVEPEKQAWDIEWTLATYKANTTLPYTFSDFVLINFVGGVTAAEVIFSGTAANSTVTYANFTEANLSGITFLGTREAIAGNWRITSPEVSAGVKTDRFYLLKDGAGNIYKLKFVSFHPNDSGTRGKPVIEYKLVKKA